MASCCSGDICQWLTLVSLPGVGCALAHRLLDAFGSPAAILAAGSEVAQVPGVGPQLAALFSDQSFLDQARRQATRHDEQLRAKRIHVLTFADALYPDLLREIHDPPVLLYLRGSLECLAQTAVAIVGSRAATSYGKRASYTLAAQLAREGIVVSSGLALGIDGNAHAGCLEAGGKTIAVLGCGIDVVYPRSHAELYAKILEQGLLVSEYPPGTRPDSFRFPARNRIISGLCRGIIVVEATCNSGSLITARLALDQGREVFAVPGRVDSVKSEGAHLLIQQGATLVQSAADVLRELQLVTRNVGHVAGHTAANTTSQLTVEEQQVMACLDVYAIDIDELCIKSALPAGALHPLLLELELKGLIRQLPGQQYERIS